MVLLVKHTVSILFVLLCITKCIDTVCAVVSIDGRNNPPVQMLLNSNEPPPPSLTTKLFFYPRPSQKQTHVNSDQHKNMNT